MSGFWGVRIFTFGILGAIPIIHALSIILALILIKKKWQKTQFLVFNNIFQFKDEIWHVE